MRIGQRIRQLRHEKKMSLGDIERRVGLLQTYVSRIERERTIPSVGTLEKLAWALDVPMYQLFCNGSRPKRHSRSFSRPRAWGSRQAEAQQFYRLCRMLRSIDESDRQLLLFSARKMAQLR